MPRRRYRPRGRHFKYPRRSSGRPLGTVIGTILIVAAIPLFLVGLVALLSPMTFFWMASHLPESMQIALFGDMFWGATPRSWAYMIGGILLGYIGL